MSLISRVFKGEAAGGIALMLSAALALLAANSPALPLYEALKAFPLGSEAIALRKPLLLWVNDGLMAVFFLLVGLEIKREILVGQLAGWRQSMLPVLAAIGGMAIPALFYAAVNADDAGRLNGWAIPAATDIAFALGVLALAGSRVPISLKILLTAIAIIDDLGAILIIAVFYSHGLSLTALAYAGLAAFALLVMNLMGVRRISLYLLVGAILWVAVLKSGIHATMAGVVTALAIPLAAKHPAESPLLRLEHAIQPYVVFVVLPIFGFLNAGVIFAGGGEALRDPVALGIALGLFFGKQIGIFTTIWLAVKAGLAARPAGASWTQIYGLSILTGIGFTMSLFIGDLAFVGGEHAAAVRFGVLGASIASAMLGYIVLKRSGPEG